jgi:hypothetical protein
MRAARSVVVMSAIAAASFLSACDNDEPKPGPGFVMPPIVTMDTVNLLNQRDLSRVNEALAKAGQQNTVVKYGFIRDARVAVDEAALDSCLGVLSDVKFICFVVPNETLWFPSGRSVEENFLLVGETIKSHNIDVGDGILPISTILSGPFIWPESGQYWEGNAGRSVQFNVGNTENTGR